MAGVVLVTVSVVLVLLAAAARLASPANAYVIVKGEPVTGMVAVGKMTENAPLFPIVAGSGVPLIVIVRSVSLVNG